MVECPTEQLNQKTNMVQCDVELSFSKLFDVLNFEELKKRFINTLLGSNSFPSFLVFLIFYFFD